MFNKFVTMLNHRPILWTLSLGILAYSSSFLFAVLVWARGVPIAFELGFYLAGTLVVAYHFVMSRYQTTSKIAQIIQLSFAYVLITMTTAMVHNSTLRALVTSG